MATNKFEKYSSKINPLYIPLPEFQFFHGSSSEEKVDDKYIGREGNIERLKSWLTSSVTTGVYLVTGFRGMGKSSFVGKVLNDIARKVPKRQNLVLRSICLIISLLISCEIFQAFDLFQKFHGGFFQKLNFKLTLISIFIFFIILVFYKFNYVRMFWSEITKFWKEITWSNFKRKLNDLFKKENCENKRIPIKLNLGHETLNERDILSLISNSIEYEYKKYLENFNIYRALKWIIITLVASSLSVFVLKGLFDFIDNPSFDLNHKKSAIIYFIKCLNDILFKLREPDVLSQIFNILFIASISLAIFFAVHFFWKSGKRIYIKFRPNHPKAILERLQDLNLRIVSATNEDASPYGSYSTAWFGLTINQRKNRSYPIADVREIEQRLSWILNEIAESKNAPKFIIVFDELDKVDPTSSRPNPDDSTNTIPAFENSGSGFTRGVASRKRKQNLMRLLANMKYFISTAKVKFIFIAGRELYDAFLADASDREFAIGSIFNGVIELKSFLDPYPSELREVTAMTQRYICKLLLPVPDELEKAKEFKDVVEKLEKKFKKRESEKGEDKEWKKDVNYYVFTTYNIILELRLKKAKKHLDEANKHLKHLDEVNNLDNDFLNKSILKKVKKELDAAREFLGEPKATWFNRIKTVLCEESLNQDKIHENFKKVKADYEKAEAIRERTIIMLHQYAVYLSHFSNGAPKKITNLFEKYVWEKKEKEMEAEEYIDILGNAALFKSKYYMVFTYKTQRKIGFIHHLFFPVINAVLNNASRYGDKLLISACFLTNHLYKYHNNGFSWRNIESIPELMDINKSPETRKFIETVILFLQRSHLSATTINSLYHYKFPLRLAEEISIMSRLSSEVSALLNFSLDDSLSLKTHYAELLNYYTARQNNALTSGGKDNVMMISTQNDFHHVIANIHHVLGDLHMFSEDYNEAIYEYQCNIDILLKECPWNEIHECCKNPHTSLHILSVVRTMLKLGLALEKRKTYNDAYLIYNEIVVMLQKIRANHQQEGYMTVLFDDINLVYQTLLARLFVLEKRGLSGINIEDIDTLIGVFKELTNPNQIEEKMIKADFLRKLADILYYKNGLINMDSFRWDVALELSNFPIDLRKEIPYTKNKGLYNILEKEDKSKHIIEIIQNEIGTKLTEREKDVINKAHYCINQRKYLLSGYWREDIQIKVKDKRTPCYACKYYNWSLETMRKYMIQESNPENQPPKTISYVSEWCVYPKNQQEQRLEDEKKSKSIFFINQLSHKEYFKSLKERDMLTLAFALDGLGNVLFSCSMAEGKKEKGDTTNISGDKISDEFVNKFIKLIDNKNKKKHDNHRDYYEDWKDLKELSFIEKSLLYFYAAAEYFEYSANMKEAFFCYKKILYVFVSYYKIQRIDKQEEDKYWEYWKQIKKYLIGRAIQNLYIQYENTNMVEIGILKDMFNKDESQHIPLNLLSAFPDLEEIIILCCRLQLLWGLQGMENSLTAQMYQSMSISPYRMTSTITERIIALTFKANVNMKILKELLNLTEFKTDSYEASFPIEFYKKFSYYLNNEINLGTYDSFILISQEDKNDCKTKLDLVEFLITDTKFALSKIIETISPTTQTTLFTESFMGGIYMQLYECNQVYDLIYLMYKLFDEITDEKKDRTEKEMRSNIKDIINRIWSFYVTRIPDEEKDEADKLIKNIGKSYKSNSNREKTWSFYKENIKNNQKANDLISNLEEISLKIEKMSQKAERFCKYIDNHTDYADHHNNITNYLHEMALRKYKRAIEMHHEGGAYQELLNSMYFLEDNLNNNTYQFHFAVERYNNNCGILNERVKRLKEICNTSSLLDADKYVMEAGKWHIEDIQ